MVLANCILRSLSNISITIGSLRFDRAPCFETYFARNSKNKICQKGAKMTHRWRTRVKKNILLERKFVSFFINAMRKFWPKNFMGIAKIEKVIIKKTRFFQKVTKIRKWHIGEKLVSKKKNRSSENLSVFLSMLCASFDRKTLWVSQKLKKL